MIQLFPNRGSKHALTLIVDEDSESKPRRSEDRSSDTEANSPLPGSPLSSLTDGSSDLSSLPRDVSRSSHGDLRPKQTRKSAPREPTATTDHDRRSTSDR